MRPDSRTVEASKPSVDGAARQFLAVVVLLVNVWLVLPALAISLLMATDVFTDVGRGELRVAAFALFSAAIMIAAVSAAWFVSVARPTVGGESWRQQARRWLALACVGLWGVFTLGSMTAPLRAGPWESTAAGVLDLSLATIGSVVALSGLRPTDGGWRWSLTLIALLQGAVLLHRLAWMVFASK